MFTWDETVRNWRVSIEVNGETLEVFLDPQTDHPERLEPLQALFERVIAHEGRARRAAADGMLAGYNETWADDGPGVLDAEGFMAHMRLKTVTVELDGSATYWYNDGDLFAGHAITVDLDAAGHCTDTNIMG